jgi:hypothetical protein
MIEYRTMRRGFAAVLVILLLAMTSWASACDLSCSLERVHSGCKLSGTSASSEPTASDMDMANMDMHDDGSVTAQPENGLVHLHANSCTHSPCNETSVSAISKSAQHPVPALQLIAFERLSIAELSWQPSWPQHKVEPPSLQPFDPLAINLRI